MTRSSGHGAAGGRPAVAAGWPLPDYPYDRLADLGAEAAAHQGGVVDLSVGTPCDAPPAAALAALAGSGTERGYPASVGSAPLRDAARRWIERRFGVGLDRDQVAACVGTKEFVASAAAHLRLRSPDRDTILHPALAYPTYAMSATLAGCRAVGVPPSAAGGLDLMAVADEDAARALALWVNSPANPTGAPTDLGAAAVWGRDRGVPVLSDECYCEFAWSAWPPPTVLDAGSTGVLAVHSLSKRSNLAGLRVGFYAGDPELVSFFAEVRKHAGLMVPGPVQAAAVAALDDDDHVVAQRAVYRRRLTRLAEILGAEGLAEAPAPRGAAFYLWVPAPAADGGHPDPGWALTATLARTAGMLVSPGSFYGEDGRGFVRVAAVQPDDRIELIARRLESARAAQGPGSG